MRAVREHLCFQGDAGIGTVMPASLAVRHVDVFSRVDLQTGIVGQDRDRDAVALYDAQGRIG